MLWAIVSSVFVMYLYRKLKAAGGAETVEPVVPKSIVDQEWANLDRRLHALEVIVNSTTGRVAR
jgi:hypothetical protein